MAMKTANIAELKDSLTKFIAEVEAGEEVEIRRRNLPVARLVPIPPRKKNETVLGRGRGSARIVGDLTEPLMPADDWEMLENDRQ